MVNKFSWKNEIKKAELELNVEIKHYEKTGQGQSAIKAKQKQLELKKRVSDLFG